MSQESLKITFQNTDSVVSTSTSYRLELDNEYFSLVNDGEERTTFYEDDDVYLRAFPPYNTENYSLYSSFGNLEIIKKDVEYEVTDILTFSKSSEATLSYFPESIESAVWIGNDNGDITVDGYSVTTEEEVVGILEVTYSSKGDRLKLSGVSFDTEDFQVLCLAQYINGQAQLTVNYGIEDAEETEGTISSYSYRLEEDSDYFETVNGFTRSKYLPEDTVFLKAFPSRNLVQYDLYSSFGALSVQSTNVLFEITETVLFTQDSIANVGYPIQSILSYSWSGENGGTVHYLHNELSINDPVTSILTITYSTLGDRLILVDSNYPEDNEFDVLCVSQYTDGGDANETISFERIADVEEGDQIVSVKFTVKDAVTDLNIPQASVTLSGNGVNTTKISNENGEVTFDGLIRGKTYDLETVATGYYASGEDYLNNDSFTVPTE